LWIEAYEKYTAAGATASSHRATIIVMRVERMLEKSKRALRQQHDIQIVLCTRYQFELRWSLHLLQFLVKQQTLPGRDALIGIAMN